MQFWMVKWLYLMKIDVQILIGYYPEKKIVWFIMFLIFFGMMAMI
jgi:hypothetical protein